MKEFVIQNKVLVKSSPLVLSEDKKTVLSCADKAATEIAIPEGVTAIGNNAFAGCNLLAQVSIPPSVQKIGGAAFSGCKALSSISLPESVALIEKTAFQGCASLVSISIPSQVTEIANSVFSGCKSLAFAGCKSLAPVAIPASVKEIADTAFFACPAMESQNAAVHEALPPQTEKKQTYTLSEDKKTLLSWNKAESKKIKVPGGVVYIAERAFKDCSAVESISLPSSVTDIGDWAFRNCKNLKRVTLPASITRIGKRAFNNCTSLTDISIPPSVTDVESGTFSGCASLSQITIPDGIKTIGECAFADCTALTSIHIPQSVTSIGENAFANCTSMELADIPPAVSVAENAFEGCAKLTRMEMQKSIVVLIDADNVQAERMEYALKKISEYGRIVEKKAYGNWQKEALQKGWGNVLSQLAIKTVQQKAYVKGKNATDMRLTLDAGDLLHNASYDIFAIVSGDSDFTPLVEQLQEKGKTVIGAAPKNASRAFMEKCTYFVPL